MRRRLPFAAVLLLVAGVVHAQELGPVDWIFLVDTSKSMRNIWSDVQASLGSFVDEAGERDTVAIYEFDSDVRKIKAVSRADLYRVIYSLEAEGKRTHLGAAIATGLEHAASLPTRADSGRTRAVVLFTDGREDVRGIENPIPIMANVDRVGDTFVYFVSMGEHELQLDAFAAATERTTVLKAPSVERIRNVAREIRATIPPLPEPKPRPTKPAPPPPPPPPPPWWGQALKVLIPLAVLALIAFLILQHQRKKNRLEGELEILRPRAAPDAAFVGLPNLQANEVALSAILPLDVLAGSDARLFVRRKDGRKRVWITAQNGSLRVNDVETPMSELYDADTIEIGDAKLRFNRLGDERPLETNQEGDL
jgi:hypothetical protein